MAKEPEDMFSLEPIVQYKMTDAEAKAFKVCLIWMKMCQKILPDYKYSRIPKNGDPRKSHLFKQAWKLLRTTHGFLADEDIGLYIRAQLEMLKNIKTGKGGTHVLIDPVSLCGEKAWVRWKIYRRKFNQQDREVAQARGEEERTPLFKIAQEVDKTKLFFARFYEGSPTAPDVFDMVATGNLKRWMALGKVSPYYVLMSPHCAAALKGTQIAEHFGEGVDFDLYLPDITPESRAMFKAKFPEEFS